MSKNWDLGIHLVPRKVRMEVCYWCGACILAFVLRHIEISE